MKNNLTNALNSYGLFIASIFSLPFLYLIFRTITSWQSQSNEFNSFSQNIFEPTIKTILLAVTVSIFAAMLGTYLAWVTVRTDIKFKNLFTTLFIIPLAIPTYVGALGYIGSLNPQGGLIAKTASLLSLEMPTRVRGFWPAFIFLVLFTYPYVFMVVRSKLKRMNSDLEESGQLLGHGKLKVFMKITLPQLKSSIISGSLIVFLYCLSEYGAVQLLGYDTLTRIIYTSFLSNTFISSTSSIFLIAIASLVIIFERSYGVNNKHITETKILNNAQTQLGKFKIPTYLSLVFVITFTLVIPISSFIYWAFRGYSQANIDWAEIAAITSRTLITGVIAGLITMLIILPAAQFTLHSQKHTARFTRLSILIGYATPGVVIALALVFWNLKTPGFGWLYQTYPMLIFAYILHFGSLGLGSAETALKAVPDSLKESARLLNSSNVQRWMKVHIPIMRPGVFSGVGLVMLATVKELPATLKLAPTGFSTLATDIFSASGEGFDAKTGVLSLILISVSAVLTWSFVLRNQDK